MCARDTLCKMLIYICSFITFLIGVVMMCVLVYLYVGYHIVDVLKVFEDQEFFNTGMYILYGFTAFLIIASGLGIVALCCKSKLLLAIYYLLVIAIFVATCGIVGLAFWKGGEVLDQAAEKMLHALEVDYLGDYDNNDASESLNYIQLEYRTCGVTGHANYGNSHWNSQSPTTHGTPQTFPASCCQGANEHALPEQALENGGITEESYPNQFITDCYANNDANEEGSIDKIRGILEEYIYITGGVTLGIMFIELLLILATAIILCGNSLSK